MKTCIECGNVKFGFQFVTTSDGLATWEHAVCNKCAKRLGVQSAVEKTCDYNKRSQRNLTYKTMDCRKCGGEMYKEERVVDTRKADISTEEVWVCEECGHEWIKN